MTFGSTFGRVLSPTFQPKSQAVASSASTWWDLNGTLTSCVAAYQPKGAASYAASKVNLANPGTYDAAHYTQYPDWDATNGWMFDKSNSEGLKTGYVASDENVTVIVRYSNNTGSLYEIQTLVSNLKTAIWLRVSYGFWFTSGSSNDQYVNNPNNHSVAALAGYNCYVDGSSAINLTDNSFTPDSEFFIGYYPNTRYYNGYIQAVAIYNAHLTSTQISNLATAMAAL